MPDFWTESRQHVMDRDRAEQAMVEWLRHEGIGGYEREFKFHHSRDWRFDFAWPHELFAVEIEGIIGGKGGRHQRPGGFEGDCEKYEAAMLQGWIVYRVPQTWIYKKRGRNVRRIWRPQVIEALRAALDDNGRRCRECGCSDVDCHVCIMRTGEPCHWVEQDLCSACVATPETYLSDFPGGLR